MFTFVVLIFSMRHKVIVLVDDDPDDHEVFKMALAELPEPIICVSYLGGEEALEQLRSMEVRPDYIFVDINMPVIDGFQFLDIIKREDTDLSNTPVIMLSTTSDYEVSRKVKEAGAMTFFTKPSCLMDYVIMLHRILLAAHQPHAENN